jgi:hypothetical protein
MGKTQGEVHGSLFFVHEDNVQGSTK